MERIFEYNSFFENENQGEEIEMFAEPDIITDGESGEVYVHNEDEEDVFVVILKRKVSYKFVYFVENYDEVLASGEEPELIYLMGFEFDNEDDSESFMIDEESSLYSEIVSLIKTEIVDIL